MSNILSVHVRASLPKISRITILTINIFAFTYLIYSLLRVIFSFVFIFSFILFLLS